MFTLHQMGASGIRILYNSIESSSYSLDSMNKSNDGVKSGPPYNPERTQARISQIQAQERSSGKGPLAQVALLDKQFDNIFIGTNNTLPSGNQGKSADQIVEDFREAARKEAEQKITTEPSMGEVLGTKPYVVKGGDTLSRIAKEYGTTLEELKKMNQDAIKDVDKILVGQSLIVPNIDAQPRAMSAKSGPQKTPDIQMTKPPEDLTTKLSTVNNQLNVVNQVLARTDITPEQRTNIGLQFAKLSAQKNEIESKVRQRDYKDTAQSEDYSRTELARNNQKVRNGESLRSEEAYQRLSPNKKLVADYEKYLENLRKNPVNYNGNYTEFQSYKKKILTGQQELNAAKRMVENDTTIASLAEYIKTNKDDPRMGSAIEGRKKVIESKKGENEIILAGFTKNSQVFATLQSTQQRRA